MHVKSLSKKNMYTIYGTNYIRQINNIMESPNDIMQSMPP
jgi:hypothetical protein